MKVGIFVLNKSTEQTTMKKNNYPELFVIGTYSKNSFVGLVVVNSLDKEYCESIIYCGKEGRKIQWCNGGEPYFGGKGKGVHDLSEFINVEYPGLNAKIEQLIDNYFLIDKNQVYFQIARNIDDDVRLSKLFPNEELDLKFVKDSSGNNLGIFINSISQLN